MNVHIDTSTTRKERECVYFKRCVQWQSNLQDNRSFTSSILDEQYKQITIYRPFTNDMVLDFYFLSISNSCLFITIFIADVDLQILLPTDLSSTPILCSYLCTWAKALDYIDRDFRGECHGCVYSNVQVKWKINWVWRRYNE